MDSFYVTTAIPYVNATPHLGFALELVQADVLARYHRLLGDDTWFLTGTDENSLSNVLAAERAGEPVRVLVERHAEIFRALTGTLGISNDDFIRTSTEPRHLAGAQRLWRACDAAGDIYRRHYRGLYCVRCESFYAPDELVDGACPEHDIVPEVVEEENYFFRLSRYAGRLAELLDTGALRVVPAWRHQEVRAFVDRGLNDFSISRTQARARGWGLPVPGDATQVMYVWFDALANYITALGYGSAEPRLSPILAGQSRSGARHRQGHRAVSRRLLARDPPVGRPAAPVTDPRPWLSHARWAPDEQDARDGYRSDRTRPGLGRGRRPLLAAPRGPGGRGRRLHRDRLRPGLQR